MQFSNKIQQQEQTKKLNRHRRTNTFDYQIKLILSFTRLFIKISLNRKKIYSLLIINELTMDFLLLLFGCFGLLFDFK